MEFEVARLPSPIYVPLIETIFAATISRLEIGNEEKLATSGEKEGDFYSFEASFESLTPLNVFCSSNNLFRLFFGPFRLSKGTKMRVIAMIFAALGSLDYP